MKIFLEFKLGVIFNQLIWSCDIFEHLFIFGTLFWVPNKVSEACYKGIKWPMLAPKYFSFQDSLSTKPNNRDLVGRSYYPIL